MRFVKGAAGQERPPTGYEDISAPCMEWEPPLDAAAWLERRRRIAAVLGRVLGHLPPRPAPAVETLCIEEQDGYRIERFRFHNGVDAMVPGILLVPHGLRVRAPAIQFLHQHGGHYGSGGKSEVLREGWPVAGKAGEHLVRRGYVVMAIDAYCFGERAGQGPGGPNETGASEEASLFKVHLWRGRTLWGMMLRDERMALDYLCTRPEVDGRRIGTFGMSMGSTRAWWLAALERRIRVTVAVACLTRYQELIAHGALAAHGIYYFVPGMLRHFDSESVVACIAPRPLLTLTGDSDEGSPVDGVRRINEAVASVYASLTASERFRAVIYPDTGHVYTADMWAETLEWFDRHLKARDRG
jgi:dienelactone hydrolase